jgi:hypothetical protein
MSARALRGDMEESLSAGMNAHITKPIDPNLFYQELARWLPLSDEKEKSVLSAKQLRTILLLKKITFLAAFSRIPEFDAVLGSIVLQGAIILYINGVKAFRK